MLAFTRSYVPEEYRELYHRERLGGCKCGAAIDANKD
jgi:hypothetical protein